MQFEAVEIRRTVYLLALLAVSLLIAIIELFDLI